MGEITKFIWLCVAAIAISIASAFGFWHWIEPMQINILLKILGTVLVLFFSFRILTWGLYIAWVILVFIVQTLCFLIRQLFHFLVILVVEGVERLPKLVKGMRSRTRS